MPPWCEKDRGSIKYKEANGSPKISESRLGKLLMGKCDIFHEIGRMRQEAELRTCYELNWISRNSYVETPTLNETILGYRAFKEAMRLKGGHESRALIGQDQHLLKGRDLRSPSHHTCAAERPCEDMGRRWLSAVWRGLIRHQHCWPIDRGLLASRIVRK